MSKRHPSALVRAGAQSALFGPAKTLYRKGAPGVLFAGLTLTPTEKAARRARARIVKAGQTDAFEK